MMSESDLVAGLRAGDAASFDEAYRRHHPEVWRFLVRLCGRVDQAEDLFQETWMAAARHAQDLRPDSRILPWLLTIARRKHVSLCRSFGSELRRRLGLAAEPREPVAGPDRALDLRRSHEAVTAAFARLSADQREVLLLTAVEGMEAPEVAAVLGIRPEAVRKRLSRARAALHDALTTAEVRP